MNGWQWAVVVLATKSGADFFYIAWALARLDRLEGRP